MSPLLDLLFPPRCLLCGALGAGKDLLCDACRGRSPFITGGVCPHCSKRESDCRCDAYDMLFDGAASAFFYDDAKDGVASLKRFETRARAQGFARYMAKRYRAAYADEGVDAMLPVPLTKRRERERGYNQSRELCRRMSPLINVPVWDDILVKTHDSRAQKELDAHARRDNLRDTFAVQSAARVKGKTLLIVDDVLTTGATLSECARVLYEAGARRVLCLVAATT